MNWLVSGFSHVTLLGTITLGGMLLTIMGAFYLIEALQEIGGEGDTRSLFRVLVSTLFGGVAFALAIGFGLGHGVTGAVVGFTLGAGLACTLAAVPALIRRRSENKEDLNSVAEMVLVFGSMFVLWLLYLGLRLIFSPIVWLTRRLTPRRAHERTAESVADTLLDHIFAFLRDKLGPLVDTRFAEGLRRQLAMTNKETGPSGLGEDVRGFALGLVVVFEALLALLDALIRPKRRLSKDFDRKRTYQSVLIGAWLATIWVFVFVYAIELGIGHLTTIVGSDVLQCGFEHVASPGSQSLSDCHLGPISQLFSKVASVPSLWQALGLILAFGLLLGLLFAFVDRLGHTSSNALVVGLVTGLGLGPIAGVASYRIVRGSTGLVIGIVGDTASSNLGRWRLAVFGGGAILLGIILQGLQYVVGR